MRFPIRSRPFLALKIFVAALFITLSASAYAEYYVSPGYEDCFSACCDCYNPCSGVCYMHFSSPHRYQDQGSGQVQEYAWIGSD